MSEGFGCFEIASVLMFYLGSFVSLFGFGFLLTGVLYIYIYVCICMCIYTYVYICSLVSLYVSELLASSKQ